MYYLITKRTVFTLKFKVFDHLLIIMSWQTFMTYFLLQNTQQKYYLKNVFGSKWGLMLCWTQFFKISSFVFYRRKIAFQVWNDVRVNASILDTNASIIVTNAYLKMQVLRGNVI